MTNFCKKIKMVHSWKIILFVLFCILALITAILFEKKNIIDLPGLGKIHGSTTLTAWTNRTIYQFLGIPFAESPSGKLRFKAPVERSKWTGVLDATKQGRRCPVKGLYYSNPYEDIEDCLNLNIYTANCIARNPVMIYIHGGGFYNGTSAKFKPDFLLEKDIVLVIPQYRLGLLGFLATNSAEIPGNMALLDVMLALKWVQKYISYFGGDANRVTLFGQSAGGAIVSALMISPAVPKGLFHQTIIQSGTILSNWAVQPYSIHKAACICLRAGCTKCIDIKDINECLIGLDIFKLLKVNTSNLQVTDSFALVIGDYNNILPEWPRELIESSTKYPMIAGVTKNDGSFVLADVYDKLKMKFGDLRKINPRKFIRELIRATKEKDVSGTIENMATKFLFQKEHLDKSDYKMMIPGLIDLASIIVMKSPTLTLATLNNENNSYSTYLYTIDYKGENSYFGYGTNTSHYPFNGGVHHSDDYIYLFSTFTLNKEDTEFAKNMVDLWTTFAINGKPIGNNLQGDEWRPINETGPYLHINKINSKGSEFLDEFLVTINDKTNSIIRKNKDF